MRNIAAIQLCSGPDVRFNLRNASRWLDEAASRGARLAVLPENFAFLGRNDEERLAVQGR